MPPYDSNYKLLPRAAQYTILNTASCLMQNQSQSLLSTSVEFAGVYAYLSNHLIKSVYSIQWILLILVEMLYQARFQLLKVVSGEQRPW